MSKRNWPDHPGIGKAVKCDGVEVEVVDVKSGPMMVDTSTFDQPEATIIGTLKLRVRYPDGREAWLPPVDGRAFVDWCNRPTP